MLVTLRPSRYSFYPHRSKSSQLTRSSSTSIQDIYIVNLPTSLSSFIHLKSAKAQALICIQRQRLFWMNTGRSSLTKMLIGSPWPDISMLCFPVKVGVTWKTHHWDLCKDHFPFDQYTCKINIHITATCSCLKSARKSTRYKCCRSFMCDPLCTSYLNLKNLWL